jgi:multidrug/hemolysin transport system ATP-binding protein
LTENILEVQQLTRRFGSLTAINAADFHVLRGERFALVGPRGAGKTTLVSLLCTLTRPTAGIAHVDDCQLGRENSAIRRRIGAVFTESLLDRKLTVEENLRFRAGFYGIRSKQAAAAIKRAAALTGMEALLHARYGGLSAEERRRADFARALIHSPPLLLLDDPAAGLEPDARSRILDLARRLPAESGTTVFLTSREIGDASGAGRIAILDRGQIVALGTPRELILRHAADRLRLVPRDESSRNGLARLLTSEGYRHVTTAMGDGTALDVAIGNSMGALLLVNRIVNLIDSFEMVRGSMQDAYAHALRPDVRPMDGKGIVR